jgi:hypothetical protein
MKIYEVTNKKLIIQPQNVKIRILIISLKMHKQRGFNLEIGAAIEDQK